MEAITEHLYQPHKLSVVDQVKVAFKPSNLLATLGGMLVGALAPVSTFWVSHHEFNMDPIGNLAIGRDVVDGLIIVGGCVLSARSVYDWTRIFFRDQYKAVGFVLMAECAMSFCSTHWLNWLALAYLVVINGISSGCNVALDQKVAPKAVRAKKRKKRLAPKVVVMPSKPPVELEFQVAAA